MLPDLPLPGAPAAVQTGTAGLNAVMWHDTATSELPQPHKRARMLSSSVEDVLDAFPEIHDVEVSPPPVPQPGHEEK
jgi:hypothetical protein